MIITPEVKESDRAITKIAAAYRSQVSPINANHIMQYILKKEPQNILGFSYPAVQVNIDDIKNKFNEITLPPRPLKALYKAKIEESIQKFKLSAALGTEDFAELSEDVYGYPSKKLINTAHELLTLEPGPSQKTILLKDAKKILKDELKSAGLDWKVVSKKMLSYALVQPSKSTVTLCSTHKFSERTVRRLAIHEIGTHSIRSMNARLQPLRIFRNFPNYIATEEGLAAFNEEMTGYLYNDTIRKYAGRVVAVEYGQEHTLMETYRYLQKFFTKQQALYIAMRVKRGLPNTENVGTYTKDHLYLQGFLDIKKYLEDNPLKHLYYGKVSLPWISIVKKIEDELEPIKYFPPLLKSYDRKKEIID